MAKTQIKEAVSLHRVGVKRTSYQRKRIARQSYLRKADVEPSRGLWGVTNVDSNLLDSPIGRLDLSRRPARILDQLKIKTIGQLLQYPEDNLAKTAEFGEGSLVEVQKKMAEYVSGRSSACAILSLAIGTQELRVIPVTFIERVLLFLEQRNRKILADRYGLSNGTTKTLREIGHKLGVTRERVRQIEERNLTRLRQLFGSKASTIVDAVLSEQMHAAQGIKGRETGVRKLIAVLQKYGSAAEAARVVFLKDISAS